MRRHVPNPYVLAGFATVLAMALAAIIAAISWNGSPTPPQKFADSPIDLADFPLPAGRGLLAQATRSESVREGPGADYGALGELVKDQTEEVVGRNKDGSWLVVFYPRGSNLRGWVPVSALTPLGEAASLPVLTLTPFPFPTELRAVPTGAAISPLEPCGRPGVGACTAAPALPTAPASSPGPATPAASGPGVTAGIYGLATVGPSCPVQRIDSPCPERPFQGSISIRTSAGKELARTPSDASGAFAIAVPPGSYVVMAVSTGPLPRPIPVQVQVQAEKPTFVRLQLDSGIR